MIAPIPIDIGSALKTLVLVFDLVGTFVFALSGAASGVKRQLDLFGVLVLSFAAGNFGGVLRDLLIGATPPAALSDRRYLAASLLAGLITFLWYPAVRRLRSAVLIFDGAGLALFSVSGAQKALAFGIDPLMAALLGMLTGIGGGMVRDVLLSDVPVVLRSDIYAVAAFAGASVVVAGDALQLPATAMACAGAAICFGLRMAALRLGWHLPVAGPPGKPAPKPDTAKEDPDR
ncbi:trimeric intracellular cation channel family protein [Noviherbaspirillum galbum]|uniref:Trimeric intracellular cation channel family protein n=1 Tax=Noviherbaspirillum galbum TaxID=2709383 RepID=A0A6B3SVV7_9BURK|nr:trimeric intracellular cation channel family protein [Noviherbaspirillum galbum]NEX62512.1 trimeric intracellular cation channel family protein [Noviherbaspirillum galbum]